MNKITLLKRDRNYDSSKKGLNWLTSSLLHSLRMTQNEYDEFEANQKLRNSNKIEIDNEVSLLDDYDVNNLFETLKNNLLDLINDTSTNPEDEKEKNYLRGLKGKLKDFSSECSDEITDFINLSIENKQFDENAYRELLTNNGVKRIQQRISLLSKYITLSGKVSDDKVKGFVNRVKEVIVVIPSTNKIPTIDLYGDFTRTTLTNFYKDNFKDFNILFAVSHLDETTPHSHMFLDLKNKKTGKYDFAAKELEFAIKYSQNMHNVKKMPLLEDYKLKGRKESKQEYIYKKELNSWKAEIVQTAFFDYFNKKSLEADLGLNAEKLAPTKERNRRNKIIEEEAKKPKAERNFNYYTKQLEDMELKINILTKELNNSKEEKKEMTTKIIELKTKFDKGDIAVKNLKDKEKSLNQKIESQSETIKSKDNELNTLIEKFKKGKTAVSNLKTDENKLNIEIENNKNIINKQSKSIEEQKKIITQQSKSIEEQKKIIIEQKDTIEDLKVNNSKLFAAYEALSDKFKNLQRDTIKEVMNIFDTMKNMKVKLISEYDQPNKWIIFKVYDYFKKGKDEISGLSAFLTKAEYSDDEQLEAKILEKAKPQFNTNLFMSLSIVNGLFNDKVFAKENEDLKIINDKIIKNVLKDKKEDDIVEILKEKDISVYKDYLPEKEITEYVKYEEKKRNKIKLK